MYSTRLLVFRFTPLLQSKCSFFSTLTHLEVPVGDPPGVHVRQGLKNAGNVKPAFASNGNFQAVVTHAYPTGVSNFIRFKFHRFKCRRNMFGGKYHLVANASGLR